MPGHTIPLFDRREFEFSSLQGAATGFQLVIKELDVSQWTEATLMVRVHDNDCTGAATIQVMCNTTLPSPDEPSGTYTSPTSAASVTIDSSSSSNSLEVDAATANFGSYFAVGVMGTQDPTGPQTVRATLSAELSVKS